MFAEDELLPISALQHFVFCERQAALIHLEGLWRDNPLTLEGSHLHGRVDDGNPRKEVRGDVVIIRGLILQSRRLGLIGRADVVELHRFEGADNESSFGKLSRAVPIQGLKGMWTPYPIDYKRGKPKVDHCDDVQLCAQALCLEEMLQVAVPGGGLFYGRTKRRHRVVFDKDLRRETRHATEQLRSLINSGRTPKASKTPKCKGCSLIEVCLPTAMSRRKSARRYLEEVMSEAPVNYREGRT